MKSPTNFLHLLLVTSLFQNVNITLLGASSGLDDERCMERSRNQRYNDCLDENCVEFCSFYELRSICRANGCVWDATGDGVCRPPSSIQGYLPNLSLVRPGCSFQDLLYNGTLFVIGGDLDLNNYSGQHPYSRRHPTPQTTTTPGRRRLQFSFDTTVQECDLSCEEIQSQSSNTQAISTSTNDAVYQNTGGVLGSFWTYNFTIAASRMGDPWTLNPDRIFTNITDSCLVADPVNGNLWAIGGIYKTTGEAADVVEIFVHDSSTWVLAPFTLNYARGRIACYWFAAGCYEKLFVFGGTTNDAECTLLSSIEILNVRDSKPAFFLSSASLRIPRSRARVELLDDTHLWLVGGFDGFKALDSIEIYDTSTDELCPGPQLLQARCSPATRVVDKSKAIGPSVSCLQVLGGCTNCLADPDEIGRLKSSEFYCICK